MNLSTPNPAELVALRKSLNRFSCLEVPPPLSDTEQQEIRDTLQIFNDLSDYQTLGVCAETVTAGKAATEAYLQALGIQVSLDLPQQDGPIYLKFNTLKGAWYLDGYTGPSRGMLVTFHTSEPEAEEISGTYGPFPLDLFAAAE